MLVVTRCSSRRRIVHSARRSSVGSGWDAVRTQIDDSRQARVVRWDEWKKIDSAERERGQKVGKEREKFTRTADMLAVLD